MTLKTVQKRIHQHIGNLCHPDIRVSSRAEEYLIRCYGARALDALIAACSHANPQVRFRSVWALAHTRDPRTYDTILRLMYDSDGGVRYDAAIALGILGDERAMAPLMARMQQPDLEHSVDSAAAMGLVRLGTPAVPALLDVLTHSTDPVRCLVAWILGSIGDERAIASLVSLSASSDENVRVAGIEALAQSETRANTTASP